VPVGAEHSKGQDLVFVESAKTFDPKEVYGDVPNPTVL
jgi:phosphoribosyl-AMP cyclohydrolase